VGIRQYKPTSAGRRNASVSSFEELTASGNTPQKSLLKRRKKKGGRNNQGKITIRHRGGGHKQMYRMVDFKRREDGVDGVVKAVEYDPCRSARVALIYYTNGKKAYIIAPDGVQVGQVIRSGDGDVEPKTGNAMPLSKIPLGSVVHNIELQPGKGAQMCRSAGARAVLNAREGKWAQITLPSGEVRRVPVGCRATIGEVGNSDHQNVTLGKAGRKRWLGRRPHVRGTAMNPVAHPMGGGEGRSAGGRHPCSPTGIRPKVGRHGRRKKLQQRRLCGGGRLVVTVN
jgi:large subunit ribosomal protein L2